MDQKQKNILLIGLSVLLLIGSWAMFWPPQKRITQGLDIQGGLSVILTAKATPDTPVTTDVMDRAELIVINRVNGLGVKEATVQRQGSDSLLVQIPGIKNPKQALDMLGSTGRLEFVDVASITDTAAVAAIQGGQKNVKLKDGTFGPIKLGNAALTGGSIRSAAVSQNQQGQIVVTLSMDSAGAKVWGNYTTRNIGKQVAIVLDGIVKSAPTVNSAITDGQTEISGSFTAEEAKALRTVLQSGALPVTLEMSDYQQVEATLGRASLMAGILAALVGLGLVCIYVLFFYRGLGLVTVGALIIFSSFYLGILGTMSTFGVFALTLPGIAGIVLSIGVAADSSILILERFKEEVRMGKTVRSASNSGSKHGIQTSIDADLVTFVSALVLYAVAIGPVKGFALTLMLGIVCDIVMMLVYKRPTVMLLADGVIPKAPAFWGVPKEQIKIEEGKAKKGGGARG